MTIATNRPDGWPQATIVGYFNDGLLLYCFVARDTQKYANIQLDARVSIAIGSDPTDPLAIKGLSLAARAVEVTDPAELQHAAKLRLQRHPEYLTQTLLESKQDGALRILPKPPSATIALLRIEPEIICVLDYSKGFGHSDLVTFSERDLDVHIRSALHRWSE